MVNCGKLDGTARIAPVIKWGLPVLQTNDLLLILYAKRIPNSKNILMS